MLGDLAEKSIDLQVFIWHDDATGNLLMQRRIAAADRDMSPENAW
jgi:phosphatidylserine/phosphatidylglycerophosphate/cardiolipin synthase-like enzyme